MDPILNLQKEDTGFEVAEMYIKNFAEQYMMF